MRAADEDEYDARVARNPVPAPGVDPLIPPGYFVPSAEHRALCGHCGEHGFIHEKVIPGKNAPAWTALVCPRAPEEVR